MRSLLASAILAAGCFLLAGPAAAQQGQSRAVPGEDYTSAFNIFYSGDYATAYKAFKGVNRLQTTDGRWIDSICYHTMIGESLYQMGDRGRALDEYTAALQYAVAYESWLLRVTFPENMNELSAPQLTNINWGRPTRSTTLAKIPDNLMVAQGRIDNDNVIRMGGVVAPPQYLSVRANEVVRCTAVCLSRRAEIMGPACEHDPFTSRLLTSFSKRSAPPNHWSQAWISINLGLALKSAGKRTDAAAELLKGVQMGGRYDHPLSAMALVELGKLAFEEEKYDIAAVMFYEATFPAVAYDQYDALEEAFRWGHLTHIVSGKPGVYAPIASAQTWARTKGTKVLQASLFISAAEGLTTAGDPGDAGGMLDQAARVMGRKEMQAGQIGARFQWESARVGFATGKLANGNAALAACMALQKNGSRRLFQIALADGLYSKGEIRVDRVAELLFDDVLREPTAKDWITDPMETMTVAMTPHIGPLEHWFEVAVRRKQADKAVEIADLIRRHRFYSTTPTGGRLLSLRWILEAPEAVLNDTARLQRRDLLAKYPKLDELSKQSAELQRQLAALPRVPADDKAAKEQTALFVQLNAISAAQELLISDIALRREPSEFVFPPSTTVKELQAKLKEKQAILAYFTTTKYVVGFAITKDSCKLWQVTVADTVKFKQDFAALLKAWGHSDKNSLVSTVELKKNEWKPIAARMLSQLTNKLTAEDLAKFEELIIVPDGLLWYVPFEALQIGDDAGTVPLISKLRVRYAPTLGLATPDARVMPRTAQSLIVAGRMYTKEAESTAPDAAAELAKVLPGGFVAPRQMSAPGGLYASTIDRLIVLDDIDDSEKGAPYDWSPVRWDAAKPYGALANWANLPWAGPQQVVLPGFHTPVERGLKGNAAGDDVFLSVMGLMASGSRTVLISRWRTGGQTAYDLTREFSQELPHTSAANAWQRAVQLVGSTDLDFTREPRIRALPEETLSAEHPFFWGGYLLVDSGTEPAAGE